MSADARDRRAFTRVGGLSRLRPLGARSILLEATALAAAASLAVAASDLPTSDAPAHLYRILLVQHGSPIWDNFWYGGDYPLASYSLLYYLPAAAVGNLPVVVLAVVLSAALFARLAAREWGGRARWPTRLFAVLAAGPLYTGTYTWAAGLAALLATLAALQSRRFLLAALAAALTLGFSPLAFVFLCLMLVAVAATRRRIDRRAAAFAVAVGGFALVEQALLVLIGYPGVYGFSAPQAAGLAVVLVLGALVASRSRRGRPLAAFFGLWLVAACVAFAVPNPVGANIDRLGLLMLPLVLLAVLLSRFRPRLLAVCALATAAAYSVVPYALMAAERPLPSVTRQPFWRVAEAYLGGHRDPGFRIEVVPTSEHWEAYEFPRDGFALARGWYRQLDEAENPLLYRNTIPARAYRLWLRSLGVDYVVLPHTTLDLLGAGAEAALLESGRSGLVRVFSRPSVTIYRLPKPTPILTGPGRATITAFTHTSIAGRVGAPGRYRLRVRYSRSWRVAGAGVCVRAAPHGATWLISSRAAAFRLVAAESVGSFIEAALARPPWFGTCN